MDAKLQQLPLVVSFYTLDTMYQLHVQHLIASCEQLSIPHHIVGVPCRGSWELNCAYKPFFLLEILKEKQCPILWVDADAVFLQKLAWIEAFKADFAVFADPDLAADHPSKIRSGTIYVNNTLEGEIILRAWQQECFHQLTDAERKEIFWDQIALRNALAALPAAKIAKLPLSMITIREHPEDQKKVFNPMIEHYQASRALK